VIAFNAAGGHDVVVYSDQIGTSASTGTITLTNSAYQNPFVMPSGGGVATITNGGGRVTSAPLFVNAGVDNFAELATSPTIGAGATNATNDGTTDFLGAARSVFGLTDIGAYEYPFQAITAGAGMSASTLTLGQAVTFTASANDSNSGHGPLTYSWHFDDGTNATGASVAHAFATTGTHTATVTVSDGTPYTAHASATVTVNPQPAAPAPQPVTPLLTGVSVALHKHKIPKGSHAARTYNATLSFNLSEAASVSGRVTLVLQGKRVRGRCETPLARAGSSKKPPACAKSRAVSSLTASGLAGANTVTIAGGTAGKPLPAGRYKVTVSATSGGLSSSVATDTFTVK
jgi:PKD repeat protein